MAEAEDFRAAPSGAERKDLFELLFAAAAAARLDIMMKSCLNLNCIEVEV